MKKIKKIFIILGAFFVATFTKIGGLISRAKVDPVPIYGEPLQVLYGPSSPNTGDILNKISKPLFLLVFFIIGLFVIISKKISKKIKVLIISMLVILAMLGYAIIEFVSTKY